MKITHYLYNAFLIESSDKKIAIDPGAVFLYFFRLSTLIPKQEWADITHIFVTHGDPDHYWHADRVAKTSDAFFICSRTLIETVDGTDYLLEPRRGGLKFRTQLENVIPLDIGAEIEVGGVKVRGIKTTHGSLLLKLGLFSKEVVPGPEERIGRGAIGFVIDVDGKTIVNLGDTLLNTTEWESVKEPDVLMIPIGGRKAHNTMDEPEALKAVEAMRPKIVIPCHYNCPAFFTRKYNPADVSMFRSEVERLGFRCEVLGKGDSLNI
ncbi:MAG: MBL fold metallo-hydrolase [Pyrinomonadaceae bacterium]|nr:MBL fold metallo-hydrolase [Pyrinomonadaceae bacterium]